MATLRHVVGRLSRDNPRLRRYLSFDYFRRKEGEPGGKIQHERFYFSSLSFYKEEKETLFVVTLKSRSQMLFQKIQKSKNNLLSTSLIIMITLFKSQIVLAEQERNGYGSRTEKGGSREINDKGSGSGKF